MISGYPQCRSPPGNGMEFDTHRGQGVTTPHSPRSRDDRRQIPIELGLVPLGFMAMRTNPPFATLDEAEAFERRRLPKVLFNRIIEPMAPKQKTLAENTRVFDDVLFRPKAATYIAKRDLSTTVLGTEISFPVLLASPGAEPTLASGWRKGGRRGHGARRHD